jgi:hypothetical protein
VRHDASQHTYLNLGTMQDWQRCSPHSNTELNEAGMACLRRLALAPSVARLASRHVINVFVSGSNRDNYCSQGEEVCTHSLQGLSNADGPWWNAMYAVSSRRRKELQRQQEQAEDCSCHSRATSPSSEVEVRSTVYLTGACGQRSAYAHSHE